MEQYTRDYEINMLQRVFQPEMRENGLNDDIPPPALRTHTIVDEGSISYSANEKLSDMLSTEGLPEYFIIN